MINYSLQIDGNTITFHCSDKEIVNHIADYIQRFIDAENWRRIIPEVHRLEGLE